MSITQGTHAELAVQDLEGTVGFHVDVLGMVEIGRADGAVSLGCGVDERADLILREGGTGVTAVGLEVTTEEQLERLADHLDDLGIATERRTDAAPGAHAAVRCQAPNGLNIDLIAANGGPAYLNPGAARVRNGLAPVDFDHLTLKVPDPDATVAFLTDALGFSVSDEMRPKPDLLVAAWTRAGDQHHDIALFKGAPDETLHHFALRLESFEHLKQAADRLAAAGVKVEAGPGRHAVGGNVYLFFWAPGGNRYEFSAEMPRVGGGATKVWTDLPTAFSTWGATPPESFAHGS